jgi:hypothetical protein
LGGFGELAVEDVHAEQRSTGAEYVVLSSGATEIKFLHMLILHFEVKPGESTANDVSTYMNQTCPRILYFDDFGPRTQRTLPFFVPSLFHISHDLLASYDWPAPSIRFPPFFSQVLPGHPLEHLSIGGSIAAPFFQRVPFAVGWSPYFFTGFTLFPSLLFFTIVASVLLLFSLSFLQPCLMAAAQ